jgi:hypothetical protein
MPFLSAHSVLVSVDGCGLDMDMSIKRSRLEEEREIPWVFTLPAHLFPI